MKIVCAGGTEQAVLAEVNVISGRRCGLGLPLPQVKSVSQEVEPVSQSLEDLLDLTLNTRRQRLQQKAAERAHTQKAIDDAHADLKHKQIKFSTEVRSLIDKAVEQANRHLGKRPERCEFRDMSDIHWPLYVGGSTCNPIAYELRLTVKKWEKRCLSS